MICNASVTTVAYDQIPLGCTDTAAALQSLSATQANPPDARQMKIVLGALVTLLMKKRGAIVAKAEAEDTDAAVAAIIDVATSTHRRGKSIDKVLVCFCVSLLDLPRTFCSLQIVQMEIDAVMFASLSKWTSIITFELCRT